MLILKYGMVLYFIINYVVITMIVLVGGLTVFVGSRETILFALPFMLPRILFSMTALVIGAWLIMVPDAFYDVQVIRLSYGEKKMEMGTALLHSLLQFNFLVDMLDAMHLVVKKWGMGKKSSVLIDILYRGVGAGLIWFIAGAVNWLACRYFCGFLTGRREKGSVSSKTKEAQADACDRQHLPYVRSLRAADTRLS